jgi:hypothetical protein
MQTVIDLRANWLKLVDPKDQSDALSLIAQFDRRGFLTDKQSMLVDILGRRALNGGARIAPRVQTPIGDLSAIMALFDRAKAKLKAPTIVIGDATGAAYRLKFAGITARVPGSINVVGIAYNGTGEWYGRILSNGVFEASPRTVSPPALLPALVAFAADPAKAAGASAKATGRCCFCGLAIGEGARAVGYGEVCASHWGLPFPSKGTARAANLALFTDALRERAASNRANAAPTALASLQTPIAPEPAPITPKPQTGVCEACKALGFDWTKPCFDGSCFQCGGRI